MFYIIMAVVWFPYQWILWAVAEFDIVLVQWHWRFVKTLFCREHIEWDLYDIVQIEQLKLFKYVSPSGCCTNLMRAH